MYVLPGIMLYTVLFPSNPPNKLKLFVLACCKPQEYDCGSNRVCNC